MGGLKVTGILMILLLAASAAWAEGSFSYPEYQDHSLMRVGPLSPDQLDQFYLDGFDVVSVQPDGSMQVVVAPCSQEILITQYNARVEIEDMEENYRKYFPADKLIGEYHTYDETVAELTGLLTACPDITDFDTVGYSLQGQAIFAFKISDYATVKYIPAYICGDPNCDGDCNVGDAVYLINYVFKGGAAPCAACK